MSARIWLYEKCGFELPTREPLKPTKAPTFPLTKADKRENLYNSMKVNQHIVDAKGNILVSNVPFKVKVIVDKMFLNRGRYQSISSHFPNKIRWYHIALIHQLECALNFNCYLGNGQPLNKKTTIVPKGRGPFKDFEAGAIDAIQLKKLDEVKDWSIGNTLFILEGFNGYGYTDFKGINSPYLWSGSNHYTKGKYVADSVYDKNAVSQQIGMALILQEILKQL